MFPTDHHPLSTQRSIWWKACENAMNLSGRLLPLQAVGVNFGLQQIAKTNLWTAWTKNTLADLGPRSCHRLFLGCPKWQQSHLPRSQQMLHLWPELATHSLADLGPESCHHYKQDCPMWQLHHLRCTTMQKPVDPLLVLPVPQQLWRCLRLAALQPGEVLMDHSVFAPLRWQAVENSLPKTPAPKSSSPLLWRTVELNSEARAATTGQRHGHLDAFVRHDPNTEAGASFQQIRVQCYSLLERTSSQYTHHDLIVQLCRNKNNTRRDHSASGFCMWSPAFHLIFSKLQSRHAPTIMIFSMKNSPSSCLHVFGVAAQATEGGVPPPALIEAEPLWEGRDVDRVRVLEVVQALPKDAPGAVGRGGPGTTSRTWWWMGSLGRSLGCRYSSEVSANEMMLSGVLTLTSNILIQKWGPERKKTYVLNHHRLRHTQAQVVSNPSGYPQIIQSLDQDFVFRFNPWSRLAIQTIWTKKTNWRCPIHQGTPNFF